MIVGGSIFPTASADDDSREREKPKFEPVRSLAFLAIVFAQGGFERARALRGRRERERTGKKMKRSREAEEVESCREKKRK